MLEIRERIIMRKLYTTILLSLNLMASNDSQEELDNFTAYFEHIPWTTSENNLEEMSYEEVVVEVISEVHTDNEQE